MRKRTQSPYCHSGKRKRRKVSDAFRQVWKQKLAESDRGSYYGQDEQFHDSEDDGTEKVMGASSKKILGSPREVLERADESQNIDQVLEKPTQLTVVDPDFLEEGLNAVACKKCGHEVELLENVNFRSGFGTDWVVVLTLNATRIQYPRSFTPLARPASCLMQTEPLYSGCVLSEEEQLPQKGCSAL